MTGGATGDIAEVFAKRRQALLCLARDHGADSVAVFGFGSALGAGSASHGALRFFSGWDGHESLSLLLVTEEGARLIVGSPFMLPLARELGPHLAAEYRPPLAWGKALVARTNGTCVATVGFGELPRQVDSALAADGFTAGPSLDDAAARLRLLKDSAALRRHRDAAALCDLLFGRLGAELARRRPAWEIQLDLETEARRQGADYSRTWLTIAPAADYPRYWPAEARRVPEYGDQVLLGVALTVDGHWGHGIRMGSIGPQKPAHRALAGHVEAMLGAGLAALRPGLPLAGAEAAMEAVLAERVDARDRQNLRRFRNGHGLGFSYEEPLTTAVFRQHFDPGAPPAAASDLALAPGMLFELHPNLFVPDLGGAALGEMVLVTPDGPECLLRHPRACQSWD
ncbi:Xaa-Pro aminopeptidase [Bosea sp. CRIB-10]|uniref:M24 family metallopeptidase n=1 Tax=Bosea sp. CRIB-10 TaxID=378404 RepID=UPI0008F293F0|nr:M24 family metallopeptidase [Bosea sp. CRIB-10]SFC39626.1 Xaa-Pro aminopeptidase [Bosea sp. CRIB-10]